MKNTPVDDYLFANALGGDELSKYGIQDKKNFFEIDNSD